MRPWLKKSGDAEGVATVEFAIILTVLLMIVLGIIEFGFDWYLKTAIANASRDGARYGAMYRAPGGAPLAPSNLPDGQRIQDVVSKYLTSVLPTGSTWTTTVTGTGYTAPVSGVTTLTVTVSTTKTWSALGNLVSGLNLSNMTLTASTTMYNE